MISPLFEGLRGSGLNDLSDCPTLSIKKKGEKNEKVNYFDSPIFLCLPLLLDVVWLRDGGAKVTGYTKQCVGGVVYYQFTSGSSVAYNTDGTIKLC